MAVTCAKPCKGITARGGEGIKTAGLSSGGDPELRALVRRLSA